MTLWDAIATAPDGAVAAIDDTDSSLTFGELRARSATFASMLADARGLVLLEGANSLDWLVAYVGCLRARRPALIVPGGNAAAIADLEAAFAPTHRLMAADGFRPVTVQSTVSVEPHPTLAIMLSTSGSTGSAKCVRLSHANLSANARSIGEYLELGPGERGLVNLPTHYSYGLSIVNSHLLAHATVLLTARSVIEPDFWSFAARHGATSFAGVPYTYDLLERVDLAQRAPSTLRYFTQAGGRLAPRLASRYGSLAAERGWRFFVMYGQTEATARMAFLPPHKVVSHPDCIGIPIPGGRFTLVDADGQPIEAANVAGELVYEGENVMMGYAIEPGDLALGAGPSRLPTGDIACRDPDGLYRITGRLNRFVKIFGNRIGLDDVERLLLERGYETVVTGIDDKLLVVTRDLTAVDAISGEVTSRLKLPLDYVDVRAMADYPVLASGKVDYAALKRTLSPPAPPVVVPGSGAGGEAVVAAFVRAFGDAGREEEQTFRSLGGDSLTYVTTALALELAIPDLPEDWDSRSVGTLVELATIGSEMPREVGIGARILAKVDTVRGFACLLIVAFHFVGMTPGDGMRVALDSPWHYVMNSFAMVRLPLFTALAGYLYGAMPAFRDGYGRFMRRKAKQLLIPMAFATLVYLALRHASDGRDESVIWAFLGGYRHLWFLETLVTIFAIVGAADILGWRGWRSQIALLLGSAVLCVALPSIDLFHFSNTLFMLPFFAWGLLLFRRPELLGSTTVLLVASMVLTGSLLLQQLSMNGIGIVGNWTILRAPVGLTFAGVLPWLAGCAAIVVLVRLFPRLTPLERIAGYSYAIYLWHPLANNVMLMALRRAHVHNHFLVFVIGVAGGATLPILLQAAMTRFAPRFSLPIVGR